MTTTLAQRDKTTTAKMATVSANIAAVKSAIATFTASSAATRGQVLQNAVDQADRDAADAKAAIDRFYGAGTPIAPGVNADSAAGVAAVAGLT
jgi:hypothetical protein